MKHFSRVTATFVFVGVLLAGLGVPSARAVGSTLYVDNGNSSCSDANVGDATHPFCTIGKGAAVANAGQTVMVSSGTYSEQVSVAHSGLAGSPITFTTAPGASVTVTGGVRGFSIWKKKYITVHGFTITGTSSYGIYVSSSGAPGSTDHITITNNHVSSSGLPQQNFTAAGIYLQDTNDSVVSGNTTNSNTDNGISLVGTTTGVTVAHNVSYENASGWQRAANGIQVLAPGNNVVDNITHDNEDSGIQVYPHPDLTPGGDNTLVANNVSYNNGDHGLDNRNVTGGRVIGNTVYHNCTSGINVEGTSANYTIENNIAVDNAVYAAYNGISCSRGVGNIRVWDSAAAGCPSSCSTTADYNLVYLSTSGFEYGWGSSYHTLAAMSTATGQESHGLQADPLFVAPPGTDFLLSAGSPAIDSANSAVSGEQTLDHMGSPRVDDPGTPNSGFGPRAYDDRGASEFDAPPTAMLTVTPSSAPAPANVTADASGSTDTDLTGIATYKFNFGDGTVIGPQASAVATHTYNGAGAYVVTVTVTDSGGKSSQKQANVTISTPSPNLVKNPGFQVNTSGWTVSPVRTGCTLARAKVGLRGSYGAVVQNTVTKSQSCGLDDSPNWVTKSSAGVYTAKIWVRGAKAGASAMLLLSEYYGRTRYGYAYKRIILKTTWQLVTVSYTIKRPGSVLSLNASAYQGKGVALYADDISITHG